MPQPMHRGVQLALDRSLGEAERLGDLSELQSLMVAHDEDDPLPWGQPGDLWYPSATAVAPIIRS